MNHTFISRVRSAGVQLSATLVAILAGTVPPQLYSEEKTLNQLGAPAFSEAPGQQFSFDLGTQRTGWTKNKWSVWQLDQPVDISQFNAMRLQVATQQPRSDVGVMIAVREADGTWYAHSWASELTQETNVHEVLFKNFSKPYFHQPAHGTFVDENDRLDLDAISAIAIGVVNPFGVGRVEFTLTSASFIQQPLKPIEALPVEVTGKLLTADDTSSIPLGIFGSYNLKSKPTGEQPYIMVGDERVPIVGGTLNKNGTVSGGTVTINGTDHPVNGRRVVVRETVTPAEEMNESDDKKKKKKKKKKQKLNEYVTTLLCLLYRGRVSIDCMPTVKCITIWRLTLC